MIRDQLDQPQKLDKNEQLIVYTTSQEADLIIEKLHQKFNHRLRLGYYCHIPSSRKRLYQSTKIKDNSKKSQTRNKNPVVRKLQKKNVNIKVEMIDEQQTTDEIVVVHQEQTTDQILLADQQQNTSLVQIEEEEKSIQWSCQENVIQQKEQYIQYQLEVNDRQQQFPLPEEIPRYQEASIQCDQQKQIQLPKIITKNAEMQCEISNKPICINEYCEAKPEVKERKVQIQLPDPKYQEKIERLNEKIKYLRQEQHKQINIRKKVSHQIQIIKLNKILSQLEHKIDLIETKEDYTSQKLQTQLAIKKRQESFIHQKQQLRTKYQSECKMQLNKVLEKIKSTQPNRESLPKPPKSEITDNKQDSLSTYKNQYNNLKEDLKKQMIKRLKVEKEAEEDTIQVLPNTSIHKSSFQLCYQANKSQMKILQYPRRKQFIGSIVKNILINPEQNEKKSYNKYSQDAALSRAYWRQKSSFDYTYELNFEKRLSRRQKYLQKLDL